MSPTDLAVQEEQASASRQRVVNDFSIQVATVNGSGSQNDNGRSLHPRSKTHA